MKVVEEQLRETIEELRIELKNKQERIEDLLDRKAMLCEALQKTGRALENANKTLDKIRELTKLDKDE